MIIYDIVFSAFFILYFLDPGLAFSVTQSMLLHGLLKFVTWICQNCYMYLLKLLHGFAKLLHGFVKVVLCPFRPLQNKTILTKKAKLFEASALNWRY